MMDYLENRLPDLQLFADGAAAGNGTSSGDGQSSTADNSGLASANAKGVKGNPLAGVIYGKQDDVQAAEAQNNNTQSDNAPDRNAEFERLIKGEYKDLYDARMQDTVTKRLKGQKETVDRYNKLMPTIERLAGRYGIPADDIDGLNKAIEEDDAMYEEEAMKRGLSVDQYKHMSKMETENAVYKRQEQERATQERANKILEEWNRQAETTKAYYPNFDLETEMQNDQFRQLLSSNIDVKTAFEVLHKDEIIPAAMQYTARSVEQKLTNKIIANGARPVENGNSSQASPVVKNDVSQLTKADRAEINRRVARGEKIKF